MPVSVRAAALRRLPALGRGRHGDRLPARVAARAQAPAPRLAEGARGGAAQRRGRAAAQAVRQARGRRAGAASAAERRACGSRSAGCARAPRSAAAAAAGAAYVGLVFFPPSPRHLTLADARWVAESVPEGVIRVALTVDAERRRARGAARGGAGRHAAAARPRDARSGWPRCATRFGRPVMKAVGVVAEAGPARRSTPTAAVADQLLIDARPPRGADAPGRQRARLRLAADPRPALEAAVDARRRADARERRRGGAADRRRAGRRLLRGREPARATRIAARVARLRRARAARRGAARGLTPAAAASRVDGAPARL